MSWDSDRRYMVTVLVRTMHHKICWADKVDIVRAIHEIELDYEDHLAEQAHLSGADDEPRQG